MKLMLIAYALSLMFVLLMVVRVWRASALDGILTLLVPFYFIIAMIKYWNEPDHNIRFHVLGLVICSGIAYYAATNFVRDTVVGTPEQRTAMVKAFRDEGVALTPEQEKGLLSDDPDVVMATLQSLDMESADGNSDGSVATRPRDAEFENPAPVPVQERPVEVLSYAEAARRAVFNRGRYTREAIGITIDVPARFRLISATDARRLDQARGRSDDARGLGWIIHENLALTDPDAWHVGVRWHSDGWVATAALDPAGLLDRALANKTPATRVAVSHGDLLGYAIAPQFDGQVIDWAEERVLANSDEHVVDCHAVRLGRRGVVEFSIVGMAPKSAALCHTTVRLLATRASFSPGKEYEAAAPAEGLRAPYTIASLATHAP